MSLIEKSLKDAGWITDIKRPLIMGMNLLDIIDERQIDGEGKEHVFQSAQLFHKGDHYVFSWSRWDQDIIEGKINIEDKKGNHSNGATHFDSNVEAVSAGFSHVMTIDVESSSIILWKKVK